MVYQLTLEMESFGKVLDRLMKTRGLKQVEVATKIGVKPPTISNYVKDKIRPEKETFKRIVAVLRQSPEDESDLLHAYVGLEGLENSQINKVDELAPGYKAIVEASRAEYDDAFRNAYSQHIANILEKAQIPYIKEFSIEKYFCDFLTRRKNQVGIICKTDLDHGWTNAFGNIFLLMIAKNLSDGIIVIPYLTDEAERLKGMWAKHKIHIVLNEDLPSVLYRLGA